MVRVINNKNRIYNGAKKGQILDIDKEKTDDYIRAGFSVVKGKIEKKNIVVNENLKTVKECKEILDHAGIEYDKKLKVAELNQLVEDFEKSKDSENGDTDDTNINYSELIINEGILEESELEGKTEADLKQLAIDNGLI